MTIWQALKTLKTAGKLKALAETWEVRHREMAPKSDAPNWAKDRAASNFKVGGPAYWRDVCLSHANGIIHAASHEHHFIQPSPVTKAWTDFGGEHVSWTDEKRYAAAEQSLIREVAA